MNSIFTRRSVRTFLDKKVETEKVQEILKAAMQAPSAANQQPWEFIVVRGKDNLETLAKCNPYAGCLKNADLAIVTLGNKTKMTFPQYWQQDLGAATQNMLLQITELGLGAVWLGTGPDEDRMEYIQKLYDLDENLLPYSIIAVGYPKDDNANHFVDRFDEDKIHYVNEK